MPRRPRSRLRPRLRVRFRLLAALAALALLVAGAPALAAPTIDLPRIPGSPVIGIGKIPRWIPPTPPAMVVQRPFHLRENRYEKGSHRGIDIAVFPGRPIHAPAGGVVKFLGPTPAGFAITVQAGLVQYTFLPVTPIPEDLLVFPGAFVGPGEPIVLATGFGHPGCVSCAHFSVRTLDKHYLDPMIFFKTPKTTLITPK